MDCLSSRRRFRNLEWIDVNGYYYPPQLPFNPYYVPGQNTLRNDSRNVRNNDFVDVDNTSSEYEWGHHWCQSLYEGVNWMPVSVSVQACMHSVRVLKVVLCSIIVNKNVCN